MLKLQKNSKRGFSRFSLSLLRYGLIALLILTGLGFASGPFSAGAQNQDSYLDSSKILKQKIAIGRFTNETRYGKSLLRDQDLDPLGKQAADIMAAYLIQTDKFLVFERPDLIKIEREIGRSGTVSNMIGVDTLILGSVVEFGRTEDGKRGLFSKKKIQRAQAKVAIRLVDVRTGLVFHSATGEGEATTETKTTLGIGSTTKFNATLSDKAIALAIEDMIEELVNSISDRQWRTDILQIDGIQVFIAGGETQGLRVGDRLLVMREGNTVRSQQTGFDITLPSTELAKIRVVDLFGDNETNEGSVAELVSGDLDGEDLADLFVVSGR